MDYEFRRNSLMGTYRVHFSMGHEALGRWLLDEVGTDTEVISMLFHQIEALKNSSDEWQLEGKELSLQLNAQEALVQENVLFHQEDEDFEEDIDFYNEESVSVCGLEDFEQMLHSWLAFFQKK